MAQAFGLQQGHGPQPDFNHIVQHVNAAMNEASKIPNMPLVGQGDMIVQLLQGIRQDVHQVQQDLQRVQQDVQHIRAEQDLLPIKLYNSGGRQGEALRYPQGVAVTHPPLPHSTNELAHMTIVECQVAATRLGLQQLPQNALVADRRRQIAEHLGAPLI